jgi:hypothetical protein
MTAVFSFISLFPRIFLGFWLVELVWNSAKKEHLMVKIFLAGAAGFGVSSLLAFLWIWLGGSIEHYAFLEAIVALLFTVLGLSWRYKVLRDAVKPVWKLDGTALFWHIIAGAGVLLFMLNLISVGFQFPHGGMDAWTNWNVVSRFIYLGGDDWQNTFLRNFDHPDYPLMMTISNAITWAQVGKNSIWGPISFHFLVTLSTAGLLFSLVNMFKGNRQAYLTALLFMMQPSIPANGMSQYADFPLSYIIIGAGGMTLLYFQTHEAGIPILAGFLTGLAAWTKNEGFVTIAGFTLVWIIISSQKRWSVFRNYIFGLAFPLIVLILFKSLLAPPNDLVSGGQNMFERITDMERYALILNKAAATLWNLGGGSIPMIGLIIIYGVIVGRSKQRIKGLWTIGSVILIQLLAYFIVYLTTPHDLKWHLITSVGRLYSHILPLAFLLFFVWINSPQELVAKES